MGLISIIIFLFLILSFVILAQSFKQNEFIHNDENKTRHKLLNQNSLIIFELFFLIMTLWFLIYISFN